MGFRRSPKKQFPVIVECTVYTVRLRNFLAAVQKLWYCTYIYVYKYVMIRYTVLRHYNSKGAVFLAIFWRKSCVFAAKKWLKKQHACCCRKWRIQSFVPKRTTMMQKLSIPSSMRRKWEWRTKNSATLASCERLQGVDQWACKSFKSVLVSFSLRFLKLTWPALFALCVGFANWVLLGVIFHHEKYRKRWSGSFSITQWIATRCAPLLRPITQKHIHPTTTGSTYDSFSTMWNGHDSLQWLTI